MEMFLALLGGVVSVLGLLLGYVSHRRHQRTRIGYRLVADSPLAQNIDGIENLGIHYDGRVLTRPRLMVLEIINVGNVPIRPDDYQDDLGVTFPEGVEIVWSSVQGTPASVTADVRVVAESVRIGRPLLNAEDVLTLQVLADGDGADVRVAGRGVGFSEVEKLAGPSTAGRGGLLGSPSSIALVTLVSIALITTAWLVYTLWPDSGGAEEVQKFDVAVGDTIGKNLPEEGAGELVDGNPADEYTFTALKGTRVYVQQLDCADTFGRVLSLRRAQGDKVPGFYEATARCPSSEAVELEEAGPYTLRVALGYGSLPQTYSIKIWDAPVDKRNIGLDNPIEGRIEQPGGRDEFTIDAQAGDRIAFALNAEKGLRPKWSLRDPDGREIGKSDLYPYIDPIDLDAEESGTYRLVVESVDTTTGDYVLLPRDEKNS
ncbi:hypothetical protein OG233_09800 [Streptomyces sp. NBC_01218]|uniref:hypothetical protein n=1 Tax=unclassified Streptomyces TaxID=2593676 RepID=UPI002E102854|nr:hypothetical protein OG233_09800 [Streptomyces sp. NBC_01218]